MMQSYVKQLKAMYQNSLQAMFKIMNKETT